MRNTRRWGALAALALVVVAWMAAPAQAGTYNVYSCSIDGGFFGNGAWAPAINPAGNPATVKSTCSSAGDSLDARLLPGNTFAKGSFAGVIFSAPPGTFISDYKLAVHQYWFAPGIGASSGYPDETTYNLVNLLDGPVNRIVSGGGLYDSSERDNLRLEGHWYGYDQASGRNESFNTDQIQSPLIVARASSPWARTVARPVAIGVSVGCWADPSTPPCSLSSDLGRTANVDIQLSGSRVSARRAPAAGARA